jgi:hypothetical protein
MINPQKQKIILHVNENIIEVVLTDSFQIKDNDKIANDFKLKYGKTIFEDHFIGQDTIIFEVKNSN